MAPKQKKSKKGGSKKVSSEGTAQLAIEAENQPANSEPQPADNEQPTDTATRKSGGKRGVCAMYKVIVKKAKGKKFKVTTNEWGIPCGETRARLQSYIGMLARTTIPIDIPSWPTVDPELKSKLWLDLQSTFKVKSDTQHLVLKSAGTKWRQFKADLTRKYVMPFLGDKKKLSKPPRGYGYVSKSTWRRFVKQRTDPKWMDIHQTQSEITSKRKYHHRLSRKGYIGLKEDEIKKGRLEPGEEPDRAIFWKKARKRRNGQEVKVVEKDLSTVCDKIDELLEKKVKGEIQFECGEDVLTTALGSNEHSGRVRAVGGYVTPKRYFNLPNKIRITKAELMARDRQRDEQFEKKTSALEAEIALLKTMIMNSGSTLNSPMWSEKAMPQEELDKPAAAKDLDNEMMEKTHSAPEKVDDEECVITDAPRRPSPPQDSGLRSCELSIETIENKVAFGMMYPREDNLSNSMHGVTIPDGHQCVSVDGLIQPDAVLPPEIGGDLVTIRDALGCFFAWPDELISYTTAVIQRKERSRASAEKTRKNDELEKLKAQFNRVKPSAKVPKGFNLLYKHAATWMKTTGVSIKIKCEKEVFGVQKIIYVLHENVVSLLEYKMLGQAVIASYMAHLHAEISEHPELVETFAFVDPASSFFVNSEFEDYILNRFREGNPDRLFFLPHNKNMHWILSIIWEGEIYILNPLPHPTQFPELENALARALKKFNVETGRGSNKIGKAKFLSGSPKQPGGHECAYVVMRYMKEIINDTKLTFAKKWLPKSRASYTEDELNEVRLEALHFIQDHV